MDLATLCEVLRITQTTDDAARKGAEEKLDAAVADSPDQLVEALAAVLSSAEIPTELRQEAAVILRQLIAGNTTRASSWKGLQPATKSSIQLLLIQLLGAEGQNNLVRRNVGQAVAALADQVASDFDDLQQNWRDLLPALSQLVSGTEVQARVAALDVMKELAQTIGEGLLAQGDQAISMLMTTLGDSSPEVRAASAQLVLQLVEILDLEETQKLAQVVPALVLVLQGFANEVKEDLLKDTLEALSSAASEEPDFFKDSGMQELWATLTKITFAGPHAFIEPEVRQSAMMALTMLVSGLPEDFSKAEAQPQLDEIISLNLLWMLEVEEDVKEWTESGLEDDDDEENDNAVVSIAEENFDRLAEKLEEDAFMTRLFKVIRESLQAPGADWKHMRAAVMAISQVVEHIEDEAWVDQCVDFVKQGFGHPHPRVRHVVFNAVGQIAYDQSPYVQENHHKVLLEAIVTGMDDENVRVATSAVRALTSVADDMEEDFVADHMDDLLTRMFTLLQHGQTCALKEQCLSGIAVVAEAVEDLFEPYYTSAVPMLKSVITNATQEKERALRGKAFECISLIGEAVSRDLFVSDAHEIMQVMVALVQKGFSADDPQRESVHTAAGRIADKLGKDFKPYVPALLPSIFQLLSQRPVEIDPEDADDDDDTILELVGSKILGLKTSTLEEMDEALQLANTFIEALEDDFTEFMPAMCQHLVPLLELTLSEELRERTFKTWELLAQCARSAAESGRVPGSVLQELVTQFLKATVGAMAEMPKGEALDAAALSVLQARAIGVAGVIKKAGEGVLTRDAAKDVSAVVMQILGSIECGKDEAAEAGARRARGMPISDVEDSDEEGVTAYEATRQSARFCLADALEALMRVSREDFAAVALHTYMELVSVLLRPDTSPADRALAFYITSTCVDALGERTVPYWNGFMNQALQCVLDSSAFVRQYAASTIGFGARQPVCAAMAPAAASQIHKLLQKHGERHRRRRAVKVDDKQAGLAVDACVFALGQICEHQEQQLGADSSQAWELLLRHLPIKYDRDASRQVCGQLLRAVAAGHPFMTSPETLVKVISALVDANKTPMSDDVLDSQMREFVGSIDEKALEDILERLGEKQRKKVQSMVKLVKAE